MAFAARVCFFLTGVLFSSTASPPAHCLILVPKGRGLQVHADLNHLFTSVSTSDRGRLVTDITSHVGGGVSFFCIFRAYLMQF